jgi:Family of unknown function (DUF6600)/FecR protein
MKKLIGMLNLRKAAITFVVALSSFGILALAFGAQGAPQDYPPQAGAQAAPSPGDQQQGEPQDDQGQDQPQDQMARVSLIEGNLSTQRGDSGQWVADTVNTPVAVGDILSTGERSRSEVELDYADVLRMDQNTQVKLANLTQNATQVQVGQGVADFAVLRDGGPSAEVDTPNVSVEPQGRALFRVQVNSDSESMITVRQGQVQVSTEQGSTNVQAGQMITVEGTDNPEYQVASARAEDDFDQWSARRDQTILDAQSWQHTNPYYTGSSDLDNYGRWENAPDYGDVWVPNEGSGWAPYSDGDWEWEPGWGWTWVGNEPWGWAPYHYGRWFYWNDAWAWWPGQVGFGFGYGGWYRPIWAPAYVSFFGFGWGGFNAGFGWGRIGWLPVGPCDRYYPWWGGRRGFNVLNVNNLRNFTNINNYRGGMAPLGGYNRRFGSNLAGAFNNERIRGAISTVAGNRFGRGPVRGAHGGVTASMLRTGSLMRGRLGVVPTRASLSATNREPARNTMRRAMPARFAGRRDVASINHQTFAREAASVQQMNRGLSRTNVAEMGRNNAEQINRGFGGAREAVARNEQAANRALNQRTAAGARPQSRPESRPAGAGWERFAGQSRARGASPAQNAFQNHAGAQRFSSPARPAPQAGRTERGFNRFTPRPAPAETRPNSRQPSNSGSRFSPERNAPPSRAGFNRFTPHAAPRSTNSFGGRSGSMFTARAAPKAAAPHSYNFARPPLRMSRPMFTRRPAPSYSSGGHSRSFGGSYGGHYSAPPAPRGGFTGGHYSAPPAPRGGGFSGGRSGGFSGGHGGGGSSSSGGGHSSHGGSHGGHGGRH